MDHRCKFTVCSSYRIQYFVASLSMKFVSIQHGHFNGITQNGNTSNQLKPQWSLMKIIHKILATNLWHLGCFKYFLSFFRISSPLIFLPLLWGLYTVTDTTKWTLCTPLQCHLHCYLLSYDLILVTTRTSI